MGEIKEACGIEIGEYIRTSGYYSFISKIKRIEFDNEARLFWFVYDKKDFDTNITREWRINKPYIKNHSFNIIDLIEPGDVINYYSNYSGNEIKMEVDYIRCKKDDYKWGLGYVSTHYDDYVYIENIKSIVTKEQFANEGYKVEE